MGKGQTEALEIAEHYLRNFLEWVRLRAHHEDAALVDEKKTLSQVARLVERVLDGKRNPLSKKRGRKPDPNIMWLCFHHMLRVVPIADKTPLPLPVHSHDGGGFDLVGSKLKMARKTVESNYYDAYKKWETLGGRQEYIAWLNHREKRWEVYQATLETRDPKPREYALPSIAKLDEIMICTRQDELGEGYVVPLSPGDAKSLLEEAETAMSRQQRNKEDYEHWSKHRNAGLLRVRPTSRQKVRGKRIS